MTVYVDDVRHRWRNMIFCHCWADFESELLSFMDLIGVQRKWIQRPPKASWTHFDICLSKKRLALQRGAVLTDKYGPTEHVTRLGLGAATAFGNDEEIERLNAKLVLIYSLRGKRMRIEAKNYL